MKAFEKLQFHIRLEPETHKKIKIYCVENNISMQQFIENCLSEAIKKELKSE